VRHLGLAEQPAGRRHAHERHLPCQHAAWIAAQFMAVRSRLGSVEIVSPAMPALARASAYSWQLVLFSPST
jgi:hypothetical protein